MTFVWMFPFKHVIISRISFSLTYLIYTRLTSSLHLANKTIHFRFYNTITTRYFIITIQQPCFLCGVSIPSSMFVQSIENLPDIVVFSDNDMKSSNFIILCSSLYPLKLRLPEITPKSLIAKQNFVFGAKN